MTNLPREEMSYKTIYKNLDIEKKHKINIFGEKIDIAIAEKSFLKVEDIEKVDKGVFNLEDIHYCADEYDTKFIGLSKIDIDTFEFAIDRLEKEWRSVLQQKVESSFNKIQPDSVCDICTHPECGDNLILVCQGCGISVHRDCYGSSFDKDEVFQCTGCIYFDKTPTCIFCPSKDSVLKMTTDCRWGHLTCVLFNETLDFDNPNSFEPIDISKYIRNTDSCMFCEDPFGTKVHCNYGVCCNSYHVSCGLDKVYFDIANNVTYCDEHNPLKSKNVFSNSTIFSKDTFGYKKLLNKPLIRRQKKLSPPKQTLLMDILNTKPYVSDNIFKLLSNNELFLEKKEVLECLCKFWMHKKETNKRFLLPFLRLNLNKPESK